MGMRMVATGVPTKTEAWREPAACNTEQETRLANSTLWALGFCKRCELLYPDRSTSHPTTSQWYIQIPLRHMTSC
jgi:hypothetical protein